LRLHPAARGDAAQHCFHGSHGAGHRAAPASPGVTYLENCLEYARALPETPLRARLCREAGYSCLIMGELTTAHALLGESLALSQRLNDVLGLVPNAAMLSLSCSLVGEIERSADVARLALSKAQATGNATYATIVMLRLVRYHMQKARCRWRKTGCGGPSGRAVVLGAAGLAGAAVGQRTGEPSGGERPLGRGAAAARKDPQGHAGERHVAVRRGAPQLRSRHGVLDWRPTGDRPRSVERGRSHRPRHPRPGGRRAPQRPLPFHLRPLPASSGRVDEARPRFERSLQLLREAGSKSLEARCLVEGGRSMEDRTWLDQGET